MCCLWHLESAFPTGCIQFCVNQERGDRSRISEAPSIRAEPRPAVAGERPTLFFACADLLCPHFQGFAKSPTTYLWTQTLPLSDLGQPMRHTQASVLPGSHFPSFPRIALWRLTKTLHIAGCSTQVYLMCLAQMGSTWGLSLQATLPQTPWKSEGRDFLHCLADIAWGLEKKKYLKTRTHISSSFFLNLNSGTQIHKFHKCSCHALNCSFYLQTGFQSLLVAQWWGFYSLANLKGWGGIWKLFWHSAQEDYLNSIFRCMWYLHEAQSKNGKCGLYAYKYI